MTEESADARIAVDSSAAVRAFDDIKMHWRALVAEDEAAQQAARLAAEEKAAKRRKKMRAEQRVQVQEQGWMARRIRPAAQKLKRAVKRQQGTRVQSGSLPRTQARFASAPWLVAPQFQCLKPTMTREELSECLAALKAHQLDTEKALERRIYYRSNDPIGALLSECQALVALLDRSKDLTTTPRSSGRKVLVDVRSLQDRNYATRGIGRYGRAIVSTLGELIPREDLLLLTSVDLPELDLESAGAGQVLTHLPRDLSDIGLFIQPSPMTAPVAPIVPILLAPCHKVAVVHDFIPIDHPELYLTEAEAKATYTAWLVALSHYDQLLTNSVYTQNRVKELDLAGEAGPVAWPNTVTLPTAGTRFSEPDQGVTRIVLFAGGDPRKNLQAGLTACAEFAQSVDPPVEVAIIGHGHELSATEALAMRSGLDREQVLVVPRIDDALLSDLIARSSAVLVPSLSEGLSLPVLESLANGTPVAASAIPPHEELLAPGRHLADPTRPEELAAALAFVLRENEAEFTRQRDHVLGHQHSLITSVVPELVSTHRSPGTSAEPEKRSSAGLIRGVRPSLGIAAPWPPQTSGVADYSEFTLPALSKYCDVTIYTGADVPESEMISHLGLASSTIRTHDAFLSVLGNSHFHLPQLRFLQEVGGAALAHDTRMLDFYRVLRGKAATGALMSRNGRPLVTADEVQQQVANPAELIDTCYWEIAHAAEPLIFHSRIATERVAHETGTQPKRICFIPDHIPLSTEKSVRQTARTSLGMADDSLHIVCVGVVDTASKKADTIIEAAAWLHQWKIPVTVHFVGPVSPSLKKELDIRLSFTGTASRVKFTGRVDRATYDTYLLAGDLAIQIRAGDVLGISGALLDCASFGMPALASEPLIADMDTPSFVKPLPVLLSPLMLAEEIERWMNRRPSPELIEQERHAYVNDYSVDRYVRELLEAIGVDHA